ncbi:MAG: hypothetical protein ACRC62_17855 [Microcoleus sp.]
MIVDREASALAESIDSCQLSSGRKKKEEGRGNKGEGRGEGGLVMGNW